MLTIIFFDKAKIHTCETPEIAAAVVADVTERGGGGHFKIEGKTVAIDFGGCMSSKPDIITIPGTPVEILAQHYSLARQAVARATRRDGYWKIHAERAYCLTDETFQTVKSYLTEHETELLEREAAAVEDLCSRIASLGDKENIHLGP